MVALLAHFISLLESKRIGRSPVWIVNNVYSTAKTETVNTIQHGGSGANWSLLRAGEELAAVS